MYIGDKKERKTEGIVSCDAYAMDCDWAVESHGGWSAGLGGPVGGAVAPIIHKSNAVMVDGGGEAGRRFYL